MPPHLGSKLAARPLMGESYNLYDALPSLLGLRGSFGWPIRFNFVVKDLLAGEESSGLLCNASQIPAQDYN